MKKLLAMALALVMICSLFAVPAMAATIELDLVKDGTFESSANGAAVGAKSATSYGIGTYGTAVTKLVDGSMVYAATSDSKYSRASYATNTISVTAEEAFTLTFDVYATSPNAAEGTTARIDFETSGQIDHASRTWTLTDLATGEAITDLNASNRQRVYFPINKWVRISVPMTALTTNTAAYAELVLRGTTASAEVMYLDNISLTKEVEGYNVNVTETQPTLGTVTAPAFVAGTGTTITVTPNFGYYLYSATLDGTPVTFTNNNGVYTYALDGTNVTADPNLVVSYGVYNKAEQISGGDMANDTIFVTKTSSATEVSHSTSKGYGDTTSTAITNISGAERLDFKTKPLSFPAGNYVLSFDIWTTNNATVRVWAGTNATVNGVSQVNTPAVGGQWQKVSMSYVQSAAASDVQIELRIYNLPAVVNSETSYIDNFSIASMTEGGIAPIYYGLNVTENADHGTVIAPTEIASNGTATIEVVADTGYFVKSATLNGEPVTFEEVIDTYTGQSYIKAVDTATERTYKAKWAYTLDGSALNGDANLVITYGEYYQTSIYDGGDAETAFFEEGQDFTPGYVEDGETGERTYDDVEITTAANNGGTSSFYITEGTLNGTRRTWAAGKYLIKWDAKATNASTTMRIYGLGVDANTVSGAREDRYYLHDIEVPTENWKTYTVYMDVKAETEGKTPYFGNTADVYIDNVSVIQLTEEAPAPAEFTATGTTNNAAYGTVTPATKTVAAGGAVTFTVTPKLGYYVAAATLGEDDVLASFNAYEGGTYTVTDIAANVELAVTFAAVTEKGENVATLPAVFAPAADTAVTFGKVLAAVGEDDEFGIYLEKDGIPVKTEKTEMGPHFKAFYSNENGQYAIEFQGLEAGTYTAKTYVTVAGITTYGVATTFVVD